MALWKVDLAFKLVDEGWMETFYMEKSTTTALNNSILKIAEARAFVLCKEASIFAYRYSDTSVTGDGYVSDKAKGFKNSTLLGTVTPEAALYRVWSTLSYWRHYWFRGIPDDWAYRDSITGVKVFDDVGRKRAEAYLDVLIKEGGMFQITTKPGDGVSKYSLANVIVSPVSVTLTRFTTNVAATQLAEGQYAHFRKCHGSIAALQGKHYIEKAVSDVVFDIRLPFSEIDPVDNKDVNDAYVHAVQHDVQPMSYYSFVDVRTKRAGRVPFAVRGRQRKR